MTLWQVSFTQVDARRSKNRLSICYPLRNRLSFESSQTTWFASEMIWLSSYNSLNLSWFQFYSRNASFQTVSSPLVLMHSVSLHLLLIVLINSFTFQWTDHQTFFSSFLTKTYFPNLAEHQKAKKDHDRPWNKRVICRDDEARSLHSFPYFVFTKWLKVIVLHHRFEISIFVCLLELL